mgnify:CR=1 FL=1|nr:hypothetical protein [uncultured Stomatobaculum sp.]
MKIIRALRQARVWIAAAVLVLGFWEFGKQYTGGAEETRMVLKATDMSHGYQQSKEERYTAELVNQSGETLQNFAVDVKRSRNGKRVELSIRDSIPAALLGKGSYLRLSYPLSANGSAVLLQQPNLRGDGEAVSFQSGQTALTVSGARYQYDTLPQVFRTGLACLLYRSVEEREDGKYTANLYLTPQNSVFLSRMPEELSLAREQLNGLKKLGEAEPGNDGVEVLYRYTTQFQATEASTARDGLELQCQLRLLYPTQIRITESDKTEMTQDVSQEFTTEAQTTTQATTAPTSAAWTTAAQSETVTEAESSRRAESQSSTAQRESSKETRTVTPTETQTVRARPDPTESAAAATTEESGSEAESSTETETKKRSVRYITKPGGTRHRGGRQETSASDTLPARPTKPEESSTAAPTTQEATRESTAAPTRESTTARETETIAPTVAPTETAPTETSWDDTRDLPPNPNDNRYGGWNDGWYHGNTGTDWLP